jgi:biopolymer transport protein TolQ
MVLLVFISVTSWWVIFKKFMVLSRARSAADEFEDTFWSGVDLTSLYNRIERGKEEIYGMEAIFVGGFREFLRLRTQSHADPESVVSGTQRAMRAALGREIDDLETHLPVLATTGSVSPYIGLFGTVWGIMNALTALGNAQQATINLVAPGIAEAMITTAMGLFAAIPAVMAYNRYAYHVDRLQNRYDTFTEEFANILQRQSLSQRKDRDAPG